MAKTRASKPKTKAARTLATGGGNATASGVNFQQSLGGLFGMWMLTETPIDPRLQLGNATVTSIVRRQHLWDRLRVFTNGGWLVHRSP